MSVVSLRDRQEERDARRILGMMLDGSLEQAAAELIERGDRARRIAQQRKATTEKLGGDEVSASDGVNP